jgi:hypothetical protein
MGDVKATTIAQRFGFKDPQLSTPAHDEIMLAIAADPNAVVRSFSSTPAHAARVSVTSVEWEWPIISENTRTGQKFSVGFVDMRIDWVQTHACKKLGKKDLDEERAVEGYTWTKERCSLHSSVWAHAY